MVRLLVLPAMVHIVVASVMRIVVAVRVVTMAMTPVM